MLWVVSSSAQPFAAAVAASSCDSNVVAVDVAASPSSNGAVQPPWIWDHHGDWEGGRGAGAGKIAAGHTYTAAAAVAGVRNMQPWLLHSRLSEVSRGGWGYREEGVLLLDLHSPGQWHPYAFSACSFADDTCSRQGNNIINV